MLELIKQMTTAVTGVRRVELETEATRQGYDFRQELSKLIKGGKVEIVKTLNDYAIKLTKGLDDLKKSD